MVLQVDGLRCGGCSAAVKRLLLETDEARALGVRNASVNLLTKTAVVKLAGKKMSDDDVQRSGGGADALVGFLSRNGWDARVKTAGGARYDAAAAATEAAAAGEHARTGNVIAAFALALGAFATHLGHHLHHLGLHGLAHSSVLEAVGDPRVGATLALLALAGPGREIVVDGAASAWRRRPNMNTLVAGGACASVLTGAAAMLNPSLISSGSTMCFDEPVLLLAFVTLGRAVEARAKLRATSDLRAIAQLLPSTCNLVLARDSGETVALPTASLGQGDAVLVAPGDRMPADGVVVAGESAVDESLMTGESLLVPKAPGDRVTAGTVNWGGAVTVEVTASGSESYVSRIVDMVREAQSREAPIQRVADAISVPFVSGVMTCAAATFCFWYGVGADIFPDAMDLAALAVSSPFDDIDPEPLSRLMLSVTLATSVLVVACPCALGLATPTAVMVGSSVGARRGVLFRGGDVIESLANVDTVVLDKTGTLTTGQMEVIDVRLMGGAASGGLEEWDERKVMRLAAIVERGTRHPIANAVCAYADKLDATTTGDVAGADGMDVASISVTEAETVPGKGAKARIDDRTVAVGTLEWVTAQTSTSGSSSKDTTVAAAKTGGTQVFVAVDGAGVVARIRVRDSLRPDARRAISELVRQKIDVKIMSGDAQSEVERIVSELGFPSSLSSSSGHGLVAFSRMLPEDKMQAIKELQHSGKKVAMVGDGVNDAPALAVADVGISLQNGTDAANEASGVILMSGDKLMQLPEAVDLSRDTVNKIKQNLLWALAYNSLGLPIAAGALLPSYGMCLTPATAGALMAFSSVTVISNSLTLGLFSRQRPWDALSGARVKDKTTLPV